MDTEHIIIIKACQAIPHSNINFHVENKERESQGTKVLPKCKCTLIGLANNATLEFFYSGLSNRLGLTEAVRAVVIGHFSIDGHLKNDHFNFKGAHNFFLINDPDDDPNSSPVQLLTSVINKFSFAGQTVLDALSTGRLEISLFVL